MKTWRAKLGGAASERGRRASAPSPGSPVFQRAAKPELFNGLLSLLLGLAAVTQGACAGTYVQTTGVDFDAEKTTAFQVEVTSKDDVRTALGPPQEMRVTNDGAEIWVYRYEVMERKGGGAFGGAGFDALLREKRLEVVFVGDKLRHTTYIEAKNPIEGRTGAP